MAAAAAGTSEYLKAYDQGEGGGARGNGTVASKAVACNSMEELELKKKSITKSYIRRITTI
jgi:hypothetical protein